MGGIQACIREASTAESPIDGKPGSLRPFRILISLLDKPEIGSAILEDVLIDIFQHMYLECEGVSSSEGAVKSPEWLDTALIPLKGRRVSSMGGLLMNVQVIIKETDYD